jgi:hypothetical protein
MGILSKLMGNAENAAARTGRSAGRGAGRPTTGRRGMKTATPRAGGTGRSGGTGRTGGMRRGSATPPASGGLGKLLGSLTRRH